MIDILKRQLRSVRTLTFSVYDQLEAAPEQVRNLLATFIDNRRLRENPVRLDEDFFFPTVHGWEDEVITVEGLDLIEWSVPMKGYDAFIPYNAVNIDRPDTVARLERLTPRLPEAYFRNQTRLIMEVFRKGNTAVAYDGQSFFDIDHTHPASQGTYSNIVATGFTDQAAPEWDELIALLEAVRARFATNLSIQAEVLSSAQVQQSLVVITHNEAHFSMFEKVRTQRQRSNIENPQVGTFSHLLDRRPTSGQSNYVEFVLPLPGGPRPAFLIDDQAPVLEAWDSNRVPNGYVAVGLKGIFGVKSGYPQVAIQAQATEPS